MRLLSKNINVPDKEHVGIIEIVKGKNSRKHAAALI